MKKGLERWEEEWKNLELISYREQRDKRKREKRNIGEREQKLPGLEPRWEGVSEWKAPKSRDTKRWKTRPLQKEDLKCILRSFVVYQWVITKSIYHLVKLKNF